MLVVKKRNTIYWRVMSVMWIIHSRWWYETRQKIPHRHSMPFISRGTLWDVKHKWVELFHQPTLMHNFLYSLTIYLLHYYPRHVSSINMPIFRRTNCIHTASGIFDLCKRLHSTLDESSALNQYTVQTFTDSEDTRCCVNTICPPEVGHVNARNMSRIIV